ncbi:MAG: protein translocase subunit SecD [Ardenticatenaceae bacterium]|nr:protein translocase subunit SecD [Anaerolineales bacterium]MCB8982492.1 protein translocase subunit SecD [Ardenticatenaceae bacterium]
MNKQKDLIWLVIIILVIGAAAWLVANPSFPIQRGLDLQGGLQVLLEADVPADQTIPQEQMDTARQIVSQRVNALGVTEPLVQVEGDRRILVELPGVNNPDQAISLIQETALLEFIDTGAQSLPVGTCVRTSLNNGPSRCELPTGAPLDTPIENPAPSFETVMTGAELRQAQSERSQTNQYYVSFSLKPEETEFFADYTRKNQGRFLTIVLDKQVISSPRISAVISSGSGTITGNFTLEEAQKLALQLRFGSLPIPLRIESTRLVGATLGEQSVKSSVEAGIAGVIMVLLFMIGYYRLPGVLAAIALLIYALLNFAVFEALPVTLTLPAITGFLLSLGMAVDANVLVFERMKEELARGRNVHEAVHAGFQRAWTSIRDSNIATMVICTILFTFGRSFGASAVQGFAITLAIGVAISMFTAVLITRTLVNLVIGGSSDWMGSHRWLLGA